MLWRHGQPPLTFESLAGPGSLGQVHVRFNWIHSPIIMPGEGAGSSIRARVSMPVYGTVAIQASCGEDAELEQLYRYILARFLECLYS